MLVAAREEAAKRGGDPAGVEIEPWRIHDLRRTAATIMPRLGGDVVTVERVLNHTMRGVMAVYQKHQFSREKRRALDLGPVSSTT
jgi:integrase